VFSRWDDFGGMEWVRLRGRSFWASLLAQEFRWLFSLVKAAGTVGVGEVESIPGSMAMLAARHLGGQRAKRQRSAQWWGQRGDQWCQ